jgi:hypothetical protein
MKVSEFELVHFHCWIPKDTAHRCWEFSEACHSDFLFHPDGLRLYLWSRAKRSGYKMSLVVPVLDLVIGF